MTSSPISPLCFLIKSLHVPEPLNIFSLFLDYFFSLCSTNMALKSLQVILYYVARTSFSPKTKMTLPPPSLPISWNFLWALIGVDLPLPYKPHWSLCTWIFHLLVHLAIKNRIFLRLGRDLNISFLVMILAFSSVFLVLSRSSISYL